MKIIMVCTGNTCRSPMAEAMLLCALAEAGLEGVSVRSAGLCAHPGAPMAADAMRELTRRGVPFFRTRAARLTPEMMRGAWVLCMAQWQVSEARKLSPEARIMTLNEAAGLTGEIGDPYGGGELAYRRAADQIGRAVKILTEKIMREA